MRYEDATGLHFSGMRTSMKGVRSLLKLMGVSVVCVLLMMEMCEHKSRRLFAGLLLNMRRGLILFCKSNYRLDDMAWTWLVNVIFSFQDVQNA